LVAALLMLRSWKNNAFDANVRFGAEAMVDRTARMGAKRWVLPIGEK
jgi:hypothetical protein